MSEFDYAVQKIRNRVYYRDLLRTAVRVTIETLIIVGVVLFLLQLIKFN